PGPSARRHDADGGRATRGTAGSRTAGLSRPVARMGRGPRRAAARPRPTQGHPTRSAQLAANLSAGVLVRVDVRIGQPGPDGRDGFGELAWGDSLAVGSDDVR